MPKTSVCGRKKGSIHAGLLAIERASTTIVRSRPWMLLVSRSRAHRSRLPPGTSCERGRCARSTVALALLVCTRVLSRRAAKALEPELARPRRCGAEPRCASRCYFVLCSLLRSILRLCRAITPSQCSCRMSISSVGCTGVSEARGCELLSPRYSTPRAV